MFGFVGFVGFGDAGGVFGFRGSVVFCLGGVYFVLGLRCCFYFGVRLRIVWFWVF